MNEKKIAVIVPAYNEELLIEKTLKSIPIFVDKIIVINDGSKDKTLEILQNLQKNNSKISVINNKKNSGVGQALITGYNYAFKEGYDIGVVMPGDAQALPEDFENLILPVVNEKADYAKGNRLNYYDVQNIMPKHRFFGNTLLPWIILNLEIYIRKNKILNIIFCIPLIASILNLKGSITAMVLFFLVVFYFLPILKNLKTNKKNTFVVAILFAVSFFGIYMENGKQNNKYLFDFFNTTQSSQYSDEIKLIWESDIEKYNNKAPVKIMYSLDLENLIFYPYKNVHNESGLSITFLDTFGDYFDLYWNNDSSEFSKNRSEIIKFIKTENIKSPNIDFEQLKLNVYVQNEFDSYPRKVISLLLSLIFYLNIFFQALKYKKIRKYLFLPLLGYVMLITHSVTGIPSNNFDLLSGDTLKPFYYSFFLLISFSFSVAIFVKNYKLKRYILIFFIPLVLISIGFPKDFSLYEANVVNLVNNYSSICEINNFIFDITPTSSCDSTNLSISTYKNYDKFNQLNNINIRFINVAMIFLSILSILLSINTVLRSQKHSVFSRKNIKN